MPKITLVCPVCQKEFSRKPSTIISKTPCCSHSCNRAKLNFARERIPVEERFWSKVKIGGPEECWEWQGALDVYGYGKISINGKIIGAHRYAFMSKYGEIPETVLVCHKCDNPACCNYNHHFPGTPKENHTDRDNKGRQAKGERQGLAKLTDSQILHIRQLHASGNYLQKKLAIMFGVNPTTIKKIVRGITWKHL